MKKGLRRRERGARVGLGRFVPQPHPCQLRSPALPAGASVCSSGTVEGTVPRLLFYTLLLSDSVCGTIAVSETTVLEVPWQGIASWHLMTARTIVASWR
ncbi:MAG: hypothetical protein KAS81_03460, partial [Anaerolineales bacterium]|nr:hypothetical protein [Anaerolineales bacterium]